ncbi:hypothetical protein M595_3370 [Lyngbya aestuarii BL J]|uniref:Uncharacterized protein n=1 Tax=Lyngbya aestuarii BL J TaxID=1348334 RepID=U7QFG3_9CYAN|nr:hypothetical protein [Lyngbya aestuarii]ERT06689.1 hypothetical protein M595_3370 [Lyngbya aestuarii BL J]
MWKLGKRGSALETDLASDHIQAATEKLQNLIATPPDIRRYDLIL